jgi:hypothetical protein
LLASAVPVVSQKNPEPLVIQLLNQAELRRENQLAGYIVTEHYTLHGSRIVKLAEMTVETTYRRGEGKTFKIISRSGSPLAQSQVFDRILKEQGEMSRGDGRKQTLINSDNFEIHLSGEETAASRSCYLLQINPKTKSPHLLKGRAWIDKENGALIKIEGTPTADSSAFASRPNVLREYQNVDGFWLARRSEADSSSFLSGKTQIIIDYLDYHLLN